MDPHARPPARPPLTDVDADLIARRLLVSPADCYPGDARRVRADMAALLAEARRARAEVADLVAQRDAARAAAERWRHDFKATDRFRQMEASDKKHAVMALEMCGEMHRAAEAERDALRAVLAPLLDRPYVLSSGGSWCVHCAADSRVVGFLQECDHAPDCPVRRRDALLGRED